MADDDQAGLRHLNDRLAALIGAAGVAAERQLHSVAIGGTDVEVAVTAVWANPQVFAEGRPRSGGVEIAIHSPTLFPAQAYEYSYGVGSDDLTARIAAMENWAAYDLPVLAQAASGQERGCVVMEMRRNAANGIAPGTWRIHAGPLSYIAGEAGAQPCCNACLFTMSLPFLLPLMARPESFALKLVASKDENGSTAADCRRNGEDLPEVIDAIAKAAESWPAMKGLQMRRQYLYFKAPPRLDA